MSANRYSKIGKKSKGQKQTTAGLNKRVNYQETWLEFERDVDKAHADFFARRGINPKKIDK